MSTPLEMRTMAALLRQAAPLDRLSLALLAVALLLGAWYASVGAAPAAMLCLLSVLAGVVQRYWAARAGLDAALLDAVLAEAELDQAGSDLDAVLHRLGLLRRLPPPRDWQVRWRGMRGLLLRQIASLALQLLAVLAALIVAAAA